jgi:sulfite exporter TauE/SafE/copper chaperone CopZ
MIRVLFLLFEQLGIAERFVKELFIQSGQIMIVTQNIDVVGMQCNGCETILEDIVGQLYGVISAKADFRKSTIKICFDQNKTSIATIGDACLAQGYSINLSSISKKQPISKIVLSILVFAILIVVLWLARKYGHLLMLSGVSLKISDGMIFLVGLLTGLHCIGMCGSFVIGYTFNNEGKDHSIYRSHILYGTGKILSYTVFGALFGFVGSFFRLVPLVSGLSIGIAGIFLVLYGMNMLNIFSGLKFVRIRLPKSLMHYISENKKYFRNPFFVGIFSGFIFGCGPLQVMYVMAAGVGSAITGAKILALFGLGTLPALFSFGLLTRMLSGKMTRHFIHASGIILIVFGLTMINNGIVRSKSGNDLQSAHPCCQKQIDQK